MDHIGSVDDTETKNPASVKVQQGGLSFRRVSPVDVSFRGISVAVDHAETRTSWFPWTRSTKFRLSDDEAGSPKKWLLNNVSADMPSGTLTAIIGASGSGKTTLLNVLAGRLDDGNMKVQGETFFNQNGGPETFKSAYILQQDCLIPPLTVRETLRYSAELRLRDELNASKLEETVEEVIKELSLKECASTHIGTSTAKGCSGGEKRRTSIGIQLLQNPSVLFADEPTTSLDATSAHQVVQTLKQLAQNGRTVIMTIHQPRSEIWELFDQVILLAHGSCIFSGKAENALPYFADLGYEAPPFVNPAEFLIDLAAVDNRTSEGEKTGLERLRKLKRAWTRYHIDNFTLVRTAGNTDASKQPCKVSFWSQLSAMTRRTLLISFRDPKGMIGTIVEAVVIGIVLGYVFYQLDDSLQGIQSRQGAFYTAAAVQGYLMLTFEIYRFTQDLPIFDREYGEGVVDVVPFLLSRRAAKAFEDFFTALFYSLIINYMVGLRSGASHFFIFFAIVMLIQLTAVSVALFAVSVFREFSLAVMVGFAVFGYSNFGGGCFLPANKIPVYVNWVKWISYIFYAYGAFNNNEFSGRVFPCEVEATSNFGCIEYTGDFQLRSSGITLQIWQEILALISLILAFNTLSGLVLYFAPVRIKLSKKPQTDSRIASHARERRQAIKRHTQEALITLKNSSLDVQSVKPWGVVSEKSILQSFSTDFEPGKLNIIMGPSGSGKTSLLLYLSDRLKNTSTSRYNAKGQLHVNNKMANTKFLAKIASLVAQDDDALFPHLTVREWLQFAAGLRLHGLSPSEKCQEADRVILQMGLKDCANTLIGNELVKGISGGEKRRVSIATQLLTNPQVLLLDEPTSGLDGFTAESIMQLLSELAAEGRTIVSTIHQTRSDLPTANVLLFARGGHVVYSGPGADMLSHFHMAGYHCSQHSNPGDFVLDLITVDMRDEAREVESKKRVERLIDIWKRKTDNENKRSVVFKETMMLDEQALTKSTSSFATAFPILLHRSALNFWRERSALTARIMNIVPYGGLIAIFFAPLGTSYQDILTRLGLIQLFCFLFFMGALNNIGHYPLERPVMYQEVEEGIYRVAPFFVAFMVTELPFTIIAALLSTLLAALPLGIRSVEVYFAMFFNTVAMLSCGESIALMLNSLITDTGLTLSLTCLLLCIAQTMAGILRIDLPQPIDALNHLSPIRYVVASLAPYLFRGIQFDCPVELQVAGEICIGPHGDDVLKLHKLDYNPRNQLAILAGVMVGYRICAFLILYLRKRN